MSKYLKENLLYVKHKLFHEDGTIHDWRWKALSLWIVLFSLTTIWVLHDNRNLAKKSKSLTKSNRELVIANKERIAELADTRKDNCTRVSSILTSIIAVSDASLGEPGTPGYAYYKDHPDELKLSHKANAKLIAKLNPTKCR